MKNNKGFTKYSRVSLFFILIVSATLAGCKKADTMKPITQITSISESGTILPELQWHEEFIILQKSIIFTRSGNADTSEVNAGRWSVPFETAALADLFATLENVDLSKIERIQPLDQPDGGGSEYYQLTYSNNKTWSLEYSLGATYTNGELITQPVQDFIRTLQLPTEAANRHK